MNYLTRLLVITTLYCFSSLLSASDVAVHGEIIYPVTGEPIKNGIVIIKDGKISAVGPADQISVPEGMKVIKAAVVTPGLIDAHSVVGMIGYTNQAGEEDQIEHSAPMQPELRAIDSFNIREPLVDWLRTFGVTTLHTGHGPGETISGQTMLTKTFGKTVDDAVIRPTAMIAVTLGVGAQVKAASARSRTPSINKRKSPGTRSKVAAILRAELIKTKQYVDKRNAKDDKKKPGRNLRFEALAKVLDREVPLLITAHKHQDIATALRIAKEFNIKIVLDGAAESYLLLDEIKAANVPVIVHPTMMRARGETENISFTTASKLIGAGILTAIQTGYEQYAPRTRVVLFEAGLSQRYGVTFNQALAAITIDAAKILDIDERIGSIEVGKDGDLALYDGDPFEFTSHAVGTLINGVLVSNTKK